MAKETIEAVRKAEETALKTVQEAELRCDEIVAAAKKQKAELLLAAEQEAKNAVLNMTNLGAQEGDAIRNDAAAEAQKACGLLAQKAAQNQPSAIDAVIRRITG